MNVSYEFVVDAMLGDLAKWLRILGKSTFYDPQAEDEKLLLVAKLNGAVLLTRDRGLYFKAVSQGVEALYLGELELDETLIKLNKTYGLRLEVDLFDTRCPLCNGRLIRKNREDVEEKVPAEVVSRYNVFLVCENCGHVYWPGSHLRRMREFLSRLKQRF
ncbi:MAG: hypothetical protein N3E41_08100 [Thermofilaceae archaeon]|nr:hypothetical protein [Thermofilaceae archaeon]MDW8004658.1 Mut7-C RNAse domain-containing protein [Thermofilaceae archaeon]